MYFNWKTAFFFLNYLRIKKVSRENFFYYTCQTFYIKHRPFLSRQHYSQLPATGNSTLRSQIRHGSNYSKQQRLRIWPGKSTAICYENFWDAKKFWAAQSRITLQKSGMCDDIKLSTETLKICYILYITKPKVAFSVFHFVLSLFFSLINALVYVDIDQGKK